MEKIQELPTKRRQLSRIVGKATEKQVKNTYQAVINEMLVGNREINCF